MSTNYDLSYEVGQFLDHHLMLKVLDFLDETKVYCDPKNPQLSSPEVIAAKLELLNQTNMVDYTCDIFKSQHPDQPEPEDMKQRRAAVISQMKSLEKECTPLIELLKDQTLVTQLRRDKLFNVAYLQEEHKIDPAIVESYYKYAKVLYQGGQYQHAADHLSYYRLLGSNQECLLRCEMRSPTNTDLCSQCIMGKVGLRDSDAELGCSFG
jgi:translation initiation factor 3 subunit E